MVPNMSLRGALTTMSGTRGGATPLLSGNLPKSNNDEQKWFARIAKLVVQSFCKVVDLRDVSSVNEDQAGELASELGDFIRTAEE